MKIERKTLRRIEDALSLLKSGLSDEAIFECNEIAHAHNDDPLILSLCARIANQCGKLDFAVKWFEDAIQLDGVQPEFHFELGRTYLRMLRTNEAIARFENALIIDPTHAPACQQLGMCHFENGEYQEAIKYFQKSIQKDPNHAASYFWMGIVYSKLKKHSQGVGCLKKAVSIDPTFSEAHYQLGLFNLEDGKLVQSRDYFHKVIAGDPKDWRAWGNLCMVLRELGEFNEALLSGRRATSLKTDSFEAWHNLGNVYKDIGSYQESISCYEKALSLNPESDVTFTGLGIAHQRTGDTDNAVKYFQKALKFNPSAGTCISNLVNICMMECDWGECIRYEKLIHKLTIESLGNGQVPAETPFINLSRCDDPELNMAVARAWSRDIQAKMSGIRSSLRFEYSKKHQNTIHIGYMSNNFGDHPTAHITRRLYQLHDRGRFKISCFSFGPDDSSRYRHSIQNGCDNFVDIRELSHAQSAKVINDHGVDILVDLVGFMKGQRMAIAALRPAPVQARWLGMAGTSGAEFFDYLITDRIVTPQNQNRFYTEKFVFLSNGYQINDNQPYADENECRKTDHQLPEGAFVFCCFNTSYKIDAVIFGAWMNILKRVPGSVLWLIKNSSKQMKNLKRLATEKGIDDQRLIFAEKIPKPRHLSRLSLADIGLDTLRVNGAASTSDALWAGIPVLTIQGKHFASRMSSSILKTVGMSELITYSLEEYENRAVKMAEDKSELIRIKAMLKSSGRDSHLFNTEGFVHNLEKAYVMIWQHYLDGENLGTIDIRNTRNNDEQEKTLIVGSSI